MAQSADSFNVVGLDFTDAKASLQSFLQSQNTLKDYNFDGSVLSTILDVLAYNTHYQSFYANMVANEMFLDSAVLRPSIVSHAKQLGYVPQSARASNAILNVPITGAVTTDTYLSRGSEFTGTDSSGGQYKFILLDNAYANTATNAFSNITVYEGSLRRITYVYDRNRKEGSVLLIPNDKIDTRTLRVRVQASATDTAGASDSWTEATSYIDLTPTSKVYFLQERELGMYELYFGDGFLGVQPQTGNIVSIEYLETNGTIANGISTFTANVSGTGTPIVVSISSGGGEVESSSRIKFLAPKYYKSQNRAVTEDDYVTTVYRAYPNASSVYVYGGETVTPPQYGKVFIAVKPKSGSALTTTEKSTLVQTLRSNSCIVTIVPEIVDADYIDLVIDSTITYNPSGLSISPGTLKAIAVAYAFAFSTTNIGSFGYNFYYSQFTQGLNRLHPSILGNETTISLRKTVDLGKIVAAKGFFVNFGNSVYHPHDAHVAPVISSNPFPHKGTDGMVVYGCIIIDDGSGKLDVVKYDTDLMMPMIVTKEVGTVDYGKGIVTLGSKFQPQIASGLAYAITITAKPKNQDLFVRENRIIRINRGYSDSVSLSLETETTSKAASNT